MKKKNCDRRSAVLAILYDDFFGDLMTKGKAKLKTFWDQNKDQLMSALKMAATSVAPIVFGGE